VANDVPNYGFGRGILIGPVGSPGVEAERDRRNSVVSEHLDVATTGRAPPVESVVDDVLGCSPLASTTELPSGSYDPRVHEMSVIGTLVSTS